MGEILILSASSGKNLELSKKLQEIIGKRASTKLIDMTGLDFPLYHSKAEGESLPQGVEDLKQDFMHSKGVIFVAPEYNGGVPPVFNNTIAWVSRAGKDWREAFNSKPAVIATHSGSGGIHALSAMRMQLSYVGMNVFGRVLHTHYNKELNEDSAHALMDELIKSLI